jgi:hypothetical protein
VARDKGLHGPHKDATANRLVRQARFRVAAGLEQPRDIKGRTPLPQLFLGGKYPLLVGGIP